MAKFAIVPMLLATTMMAAPAFAATDSAATAGSPPTTNPATAGSPATTSPATAGSAANANPAAPAPGAASTSNSAASHGAIGMRPNHTTSAGAAASAQQTATYMTEDGQIRVAKVVGADVYNDKGVSVGSIDDVLMSHDNKATMAVISVGGFLGMGGRLVSVPFDQLKIEKNKIVMPGATKDALKSMPEFHYNHA